MQVPSEGTRRINFMKLYAVLLFRPNYLARYTRKLNAITATPVTASHLGCFICRGAVSRANRTRHGIGESAEEPRRKAEDNQDGAHPQAIDQLAGINHAVIITPIR